MKTISKPTTNLIDAICDMVVNLNENHFIRIFHSSRHGWGYFYNKWYQKAAYKRDFPGVYLNIDDPGQKLVAKYISIQYFELVKEISNEDISDLMHQWFLFTWNFSSEFWSRCFPGEEEKYQKMCGKTGKGFINYITAPGICKMYLKLSPEQKQRVITHAFEEYQNYIEEIEKRRKWRIELAGFKAKMKEEKGIEL